ncbi:MAG: hypothetical protein ACI8QT_000489 [Halioglobus sp.]|jgi:hypothetical protein
MKRNIILHIGRHKSGTSSLQKFLCDNEEFLTAKGFYYPKALRRQIAHHPLAQYYDKNQSKHLTKEDLLEIEEFWAEIKQHKNIIISSEAFQNINPKKMKVDFKDFNIKVVVYVRDQVSYLLSSYAQAVKARKVTLTLERYEATQFKNMNYLKFIKRWEKAFSSVELIIGSFSKQHLLGGDIRKDFLIRSDICQVGELDNLDYAEGEKNISIGGGLLEFKRLLNFTDFDRHIDFNKLYKVLQDLAKNNASYKLTKDIPEGLYNLFIKKYNSSNNDFSREYLKTSELRFHKPEMFRNQFQLNAKQLDAIFLDIGNEDPGMAANLKKQKAYLYRAISSKRHWSDYL